MNKILVILLFLLFATGCAVYQPQMNVNLSEYFDAQFKRTNRKEDMAYYRVITYKAPNTPIGIIKDYYRSGQLQSEFYCTYIDYKDDTKNIYDGEAKWYYPNGITSQVLNFNAGKLNGKTSLFNTEGAKAQELNWSNNILLERTAFDATGKAIPQPIRYKSVVVYPETYMDGGIDTWGIALTLRNLFIADEFYLLHPASTDADKLTLHCHIHHTLISGNFTHDLTITLKNSANETVGVKSVTSGLLRDIGKITYDMMAPKYLLPTIDLEDNIVKNTVETENKSENNTNSAPKPTIAQPKVAKASELEYAKKGCTTCSGHGKINCSKCQGTQKIDCSTCSGSGKMQCNKCYGRGTEQVQKQVQVQEQVPEQVSESYYDSYSRSYKYRYVTKYVYKYVYRYRTVDETCSRCYGNRKIDCSDYSCRYGKKTCNAYNCTYGLNTCSVCSGSGTVVDYNNLIPKKN